ncbi:MAG: VWA-like domain-containing protein [Planctomycetota bacterium]
MSPPASQAPARERITQVVEGWFLTEPLLFAAWTLHEVTEQPSIETIRVGGGKIEFNPAFIAGLKRADLKSVLTFEAMRILLGHPYARRQRNAELSYTASNITVQECLRTPLPMPRANEIFGEEGFDEQYFEFYYRELSERAQDEPDESPPGGREEVDEQSGEDGAGRGREEQGGDPDDSEPTTDNGEPDTEDGEPATEDSEPSQEDSPWSPDTSPADTSAYSDAGQVGLQNTANWDADDLLQDEIHAAVQEAAENEGWGSVPGHVQEKLIANLQPKLDYRGVLRNFRQSVLSVRRNLTRMKPSRRYGFAQMGSRYDFTTKLLFAVDVSGSMGKRDLERGFSVVSKFFRYGVESVDVLWFDTQIQGDAVTLRRARSEFQISGRGGTDFAPVLSYIDEHRSYDGLIIYTDGYAAVPPKPKNQRTRVLWLFKDEATHNKMQAGLKTIGRAAFLITSGRNP